MKKFLVLLLCAMMMFAFVACEPDTPEPEKTETVVFETDITDGKWAMLTDEYWNNKETTGVRTIDEDGTLVVASGKGTGFYLNKSTGNEERPTIEMNVGDTYEVSFKITKGSGSLYIGACIVDADQHAAYSNTLKEVATGDTITYTVKLESEKSIVVNVGGTSDTQTITTTCESEGLPIVNITSMVANEQTTLNIDDFKIVKK